MVTAALTGLNRLIRFGLLTGAASAVALGFVYETKNELIGTGDFDGDGQQDVVVVDRTSGKYRLGYGQDDGGVEWINHRLAGLKGVTGLAVGKVMDDDSDALVFTAADDNLITYADASDRGVPAKPVEVFFLSLGPNKAAAVDVGGDGNTGLADLVVTSVYNDPTPNLMNLFRNVEGEMEPLEDLDDDATAAWLNSAAAVPGGEAIMAGIWKGKDADTFRVLDFSSGQAEKLVELKGLAKGSAYAVAKLTPDSIVDLVFYKPGSTEIKVVPVLPSGDGIELGEPAVAEADEPIMLLVTVANGKRVIALHTEGEKAVVYGVTDWGEAEVIHEVEARSGDLFFGASPTPNGFVLLSAPDYSRLSTHYQLFTWTTTGAEGGELEELASLAESDDATVPDIHKHITTVLKEEGFESAADMRSYTNTIPGTTVTYTMIAIPGGKFVMGSPEDEADRGEDESPQHEVTIDPFWMGQFEVTWNEYELFMYPDDEKKLRKIHVTDDAVDEVSDAVTRPSKPYTEMSFGMGRDGYPAICMTQHAANKYCHWLSSKTGHFYRLPTEAEWEYACRAGTTTPFSFGEDDSKLDDYAWYEMNSDFKYQKVGKKKPNPWGLYDMHGNVWEYCLDQYADSYEVVLDQTKNPWNKATAPYPHSVRGGSYDDMASSLRSAARRGSDPSWKMRDPQLPKSVWWFSDAPWVGIRLVRPLEVPGPEKLQQVWTSGVEKE